MNRELHKMYQATAEDLLFGIGLLCLPDSASAPCVTIYYREWSRAKLELIRDSLSDGVVVSVKPQADGFYAIRIATSAQMTVGMREDGHDHLLRAPTWDAQLVGVETDAFDAFTDNRRIYAGFLLVLQTPEWEFVAGVDDATGTTIVGPVERRTLPTPSNSHDA